MKLAAVGAALVLGLMLGGCSAPEVPELTAAPEKTVAAVETLPTEDAVATPTAAPMTDAQRKWVAFQFSVGTKLEKAMRATYCRLDDEGRMSEATTVAAYGTVTPEQVMAWMTEWCAAN